MLFLKNKNATKRWTKVLLFVTLSFVALALLVVLLISPISKYLIEKYSVEYIGRNIKMAWVYVNPFTGYAHFSDLKIYESDSLPSLTVSDSVFFSAKGVSVNVAMLKLLSKTFEISELKLNQPKGVIIQKKKEFNFSDLVSKFSAKKSDSTDTPAKFSIQNIKVVNGEFRYIEKLIPINYFVKDVNIDSQGYGSSSDSVAVNFAFVSGIGGGSLKGDFSCNLKTLDYNLAILANKFDLNILEQYLKELANYGTLSATLDANFISKGNFNDAEGGTNKGMLTINNLHFGKNPNDDYASCSKFVVVINEVSPKKLVYQYDSIIITEPYIKFEKFDDLDNFQAMFGENFSNIALVQSDSTRFNLILKIGDYLKVLRKNFFRSNFKVNKLAVDKGIVKFVDYSQSEKFSIEANPFYLSADSIYKTQKRVEIYIKSGVQPYGKISASLSINPKESSNYEFKYNFQGLPASMFNPYIITLTSYPFDRGTLELNGNWVVRNGNIKSNNHLLVIDPRLGKRIKNEDVDRIPLPLIMYFVREQGNVIDYHIPINGNLKNPKFHWKDVVTDVLRNVFVKPPTAPYRSFVKDVEVEIEKSLTLKWEIQQTLLLAEQKKFVNIMADELLKNPNALIEVFPIVYTEKEMEHIALFEAKKKYLLQLRGKKEQFMSLADLENVSRMSIKDPLFVAFLNEQTKGKMLFTVQGKCNALIGQANIEAKQIQLNTERNDAFMLHFKRKGVESRVKIHPAESAIPYNGFSFYKVNYKGKLPKSLAKAYRQMDELNTQSPRRKYDKKREKIESKVLGE
jgi:hypothetical protein